MYHTPPDFSVDITIYPHSKDCGKTHAIKHGEPLSYRPQLGHEPYKMHMGVCMTVTSGSDLEPGDSGTADVHVISPTECLAAGFFFEEGTQYTIYEGARPVGEVTIIS